MSRANGAKRRRQKAAKIRALADRATTVGEQQAAEAALERIAGTPAILREREPLSDSLVKRLPLPAAGNRVHWDTALPGFGVRTTAGGARSFVLDYRTRDTGRRRRFTIGQFPTWTTGAARIQARELRRRIDVGEDPLADFEEARTAPTVDELATRFEAEHLPRLRPSTQENYRRMLRLHVRPHFGKHIKVADVAFANIDALHRKVTAGSGPYVANRTIALASKMFALAKLWNMRADNPVIGVERNLEVKRKRYLSADELARFVKALAEHQDPQPVSIIRFLLMVGCRKGEAFAMRWSAVDLDTGIWTKLGSTTKQKSDHVVALSTPVLQLLREIRDQQTAKRRVLGEFVFPSIESKTGHVVDIGKTWKRVCRAANIKGLRIHDLRHSFASQLASNGASLPLIGALLGHSNPATTARYAHLFVDPQREAAEKVGAVIIAAGASATRSASKITRRGSRHG